MLNVRRRALAYGVVFSFASIGGIIWPIFFSNLFARIGYGWTIRIQGFLTIALLAVSVVFSKKRQVFQPLDQADQGQREEKSSSRAQSAYADLNVWGLGLTYFLARKEQSQLQDTYDGTELGLYQPFFYMPGFTESVGGSHKLAFYTVSIINGSSLFGRTSLGWLGDRYGRLNMYIVSVMMSGIIQFCWIPVRSVAGTLCIAVLFGFFSGAFLALAPASFSQVVGEHQLGTKLGLFSFLGGAGALIGAPICIVTCMFCC